MPLAWVTAHTFYDYEWRSREFFLRAATAVFVQRGKKELEKCKEKCQNEAVSVCVGEMF